MCGWRQGRAGGASVPRGPGWAERGAPWGGHGAHRRPSDFCEGPMPTFPCERRSVVWMCPSPSPAGPGPPCGPCSAWSPARSPLRSGPSGRAHSSSPRLSSVGGLCVPRLRVSSASLAGLRASAPGGGVCGGRRVRWERGKGWREGRRACSIFTRQLLRAAAFKAAPLCRPHSLRPTTGHSQPGSDAAPGGCLPTRPELRGEPNGDPGRGLREPARAWDGRGCYVGSAGGTVPKHGIASRGVTPLLPSEG